jgi:putative endonuclease
VTKLSIVGPNSGLTPSLTFKLYNGDMYYFYVLENQDDELYYGSTNDLKRRLKEHIAGKSFATKGSNWELIYYEAYNSELDARRREQRIKDFGQACSQLKKRIINSRRLQS